MNPLYIKTPLIRSTILSQKTGANIFLKIETLQPSGSFKIRGIGGLCQKLKEKGSKRFVSSSGGNAGLAVAYAGSQLNTPVTVVLPLYASEVVKKKIKRLGAEVISHGEHWGLTDKLARSLAAENSHWDYIHPFDHEELWQGHGTLIQELLEDGFKPDRVIVSVGGGGLLCGIVRGLESVGWSEIPINSVETKGADCFAQAIEANEIVTLKKIESLASSLGSPYLAKKALEFYHEKNITHQVITDRQAIQAVLNFADDHQILVEPACGASLALLYEDLLKPDPQENVLVVVCGGTGVNLQLMEKWSEVTGITADRKL